MNGTPIRVAAITVSPRVPVDDLCRRVRVRLHQDHVVELVATTGDGRQIRQLRRVAARLAATEGILCSSLEDRSDGGTYLTVIPEAGYAVAWFPGTPKVGTP